MVFKKQIWIFILFIISTPVTSFADKLADDYLSYEKAAKQAYMDGDYEKSIKYYEESLPLVLNIAHRMKKQSAYELAASHYSMMSAVLAEADQDERALEFLKKAIDYSIKMNIVWSTNSTLKHATTLIVSNYQEQGKLEKAKEYTNNYCNYVQSLQATPTLTAELNACLANKAKLNEDHNRALQYYLKALKINETIFGKNHKVTSSNYQSIGFQYNALADYIRAIEYQQKALEGFLYLNLDYAPEVAILYKSLGILHQQIGDTPTSLDYFNKALVLIERDNGKAHINNASVYSSLSSLHHQLGDHKKALSYAHKALQITEKAIGKYTATSANIYYKIGMFHFGMGKWSQGINYHKQSLEIRQKALGDKHPDTAKSWDQLAFGYFFLDQKDLKVLKYYKKSLEINKSIWGESHMNTGESYYNMSFPLMLQGDWASSYDYAKKSFDIYITSQNKRFEMLNFKQKQEYQKKNEKLVGILFQSAYLKLMSLLQEQKMDEVNQLVPTVFNDWLNFKGSLYNNENAIVTLYENTTDKKVRAEIDALTKQKRQLAKLYQTLPKTKAERAGYQQQLINAENAITESEQRLSKKATSFEQAKGLQTIRYEDIRDNLKEDELYLDYVKAGKFYYLFTLNSEDVFTFNQIGFEDSAKIDQLVANFRKDTKSIALNKNLSAKQLASLKISSQKTLSELYQLTLVTPLKIFVEDLLEKPKKFIISPDGALRVVPFEAFYNKKTGKYLLEEKSIRYIPSGKELVRLYRYAEKKKNNKSIVLFNNPDFNAKGTTAKEASMLDTPNTSRSAVVKSLYKMRFAALPGTKEEVKNIKPLLSKSKVKDFSETSASEKNLLKVKQPKILHVATHGFFLNDETIPNPMLRSGIALSGANASAVKGKGDGIVTALKLSGLNLKGTELVVLSACETGVVDINSTEGVSGLNKAFIQAGAKNVVMSLWAVADKETVELMSGFYKQMQSEDDYADALRNSKLTMIKQGLHPYYWAAFIISGARL
ncbi:MAG: CHAT domain-containing protein [Methylophaga sp.]|nr:CHAT domain-containing protein [Methylophaga sp.]